LRNYRGPWSRKVDSAQPQQHVSRTPWSSCSRGQGRRTGSHSDSRCDAPGPWDSAPALVHVHIAGRHSGTVALHVHIARPPAFPESSACCSPRAASAPRPVPMDTVAVAVDHHPPKRRTPPAAGARRTVTMAISLPVQRGLQHGLGSSMRNAGVTSWMARLNRRPDRLCRSSIPGASTSSRAHAATSTGAPPPRRRRPSLCCDDVSSRALQVANGGRGAGSHHISKLRLT
jgi:hypothetical protein